MKSRRMRRSGHVAWVEEVRNSCSIFFFFFGKSEVKRPLGRLRRICKDNIGMNVREIGWKSMDWMHLALGSG
jgi:hypothetical protein